MKKKIVVCISLIMACMLVGCGGSNNGDSEGKNSQQESGMNETQDKNDENIELKGYVFQGADAQGTGKVNIVIDAKADKILKDLGKANFVFESPSCAFGDLDIIYTYNGFEVDTYSMDGVEYISAVVLLDDTVETPEGVCIGDELAKVKEAYGEPTKSDDRFLEYRKDHMKLSFIIQDGNVVSIEYLTTILE